MSAKHAADQKGASRWPYIIIILAVLGLFAGFIHATRIIADPVALPKETAAEEEKLPDWIQQAIIPVDGVSRRGVPLEGVDGIVVHYVGNPGTTARQNRDWYADPESEVSSHFLIGLEGEVLLCVPLDEKSSASNQANTTTISVEVCHPDESGKFTEASEETLVRLLAYLCRRFDLTVDDIIRHYDVTGKICPKYYVEHEDAYLAMKERVKTELSRESGS